MSNRRHSASSIFSRFRGSPATDTDPATPSPQPQKVVIRSLPSGGRSRGPRRMLSFESLQSTGRSVTSCNSSVKAFSIDGDQDSAYRRFSTSSSGYSLPSRASTRSQMDENAGSNNLTPKPPRQILRQGRTYAPPSSTLRDLEKSNASETSLQVAKLKYTTPPGRRCVATSPPSSGSRHRMTGYAHFSRPLDRIEDLDSDSELSGASATGTPSPTQLRRGVKPLQDGENRLIRRPNALPLVHNATARLRAAISLDERDKFKVRPLDLFLDATSTEDEETCSGAWTDICSWYRSGEEYAADDPNYDEGSDLSSCSDSEEDDFGCQGLLRAEYEEMLRIHPGYRWWIIEVVDQWPEELRAYGYRQCWGLPQNRRKMDKSRLTEYFRMHGMWWEEY